MDTNQGDVHGQIAHVFVDLFSLIEDDDNDADEDAIAAQIEVAQARAFELGGIEVHISDDGDVKIDPGKLMGGAVAAMVALFGLAARNVDVDDRDDLITAWREQIDGA